jgi:ABC-type multidrug transport system permease subunit/ABC-type multidrug transport system ATPase subunit
MQILTLYAQRPIVEKHSRYALYHPSAEAIASMLCDLPYKIINGIIFNLTLYFMTNLRREPGAFFFFLLFSYATVLVMSMIFRTIASATRTLFQALVPAAIIILDLVVFTGFVLPKRYMLGWCKWLYWLDPLAYAFEALMVNEFHNREFECTDFVPNSNLGVPGYDNISGKQRVCSTVGAVQGEPDVNGDRYTEMAFDYQWDHRWRNFGIIIAYIIFFLGCYMVAAELVSEKKSKGEVLVYRRGHKPAAATAAEKKHHDPEAAMANIGPVVTAERSRGQDGGILQQQTSVFQWHDVCYDVKIKSETRRILDHVDGWVKPGTLTALMGVSGAGKTTLLDCLADRTSMGVITGEMLVDGRPRDMSFQRKTGYVQQQDLHLQTTTVREALNFSAILRQPAHVPKEEKIAYVNEVIKLLEMEEYADAVVGVPGEGLNVEQRKRLTIGVELAAKPPLLLFVDEPTSGLDSQTSWAILDLLEKLTKAGQAVLCTIHQPSAMLFQRFDRLLFLAKGGKTVYFGDIGENSKTMTSYFERNGGHPCPAEANPAEWMLEVIGAAPGSHTDVDWFQAWRDSPEYRATQDELELIKQEKQDEPVTSIESDPGSYREFAAPFMVQLRECLFRVFQQYWRMPVYIYSKTALCTLVALFVGFVFFRAPNSIQGLQNQMFAIFQLLTVFGQIVQQSMPQFVIQRSLYEVRERPSKVYSWKVFMLAQIIVELPWNSLMAVIMYFCWYYPVGLWRNAEAADQVTERGALMFLFLLMFLLFTGTFSTFIIAGFETAEAGGNVANLMFTLCLIFCGVLATKENLPGFWGWMLVVSPFKYMIAGMLATAVANTEVICADNEIVTLQPRAGESCLDYLGPYSDAVGGRILNENATADCRYCPISDTNTFLAGVDSYYSERWQNFGVLWVYVFFNIFAALFVYWLARVPKKNLGKEKGSKKEKKEKKKEEELPTQVVDQPSQKEKVVS